MFLTLFAQFSLKTTYFTIQNRWIIGKKRDDAMKHRLHVIVNVNVIVNVIILQYAHPSEGKEC